MIIFGLIMIACGIFAPDGFSGGIGCGIGVGLIMYGLHQKDKAAIK